MLLRHCHEGRWYLVEAPERTRVFRSKLVGFGMLLVLWEGREIPVFDEPSELIVRLAEAGKYGLKLIGTDEPGIPSAHA
jgi:hypothetical protein